MLKQKLTQEATKLTTKASASKSWVDTVLASAQRLGVERAALLAQAGLTESDVAQSRLPIDGITRLWRVGGSMSGMPGFGLRTGMQIGPASLNIVSYLLMSSANLRSALALLQSFQRLISDGGRFQLLAGSQESWLIYHPQQGDLAFSHHQIEAVLVAVVHLAHWAVGERVAPKTVQFAHAPQATVGEYQAALGAPITFEGAFNGLLLANDLLDRPLPQADATLASLHSEYAAAQLEALAQHDDLLDSLGSWLRHHLSQPDINRAAAARHLGLSERTLARRLAQVHGTSFLRLLDKVRQEQCLQLMKTTTLALPEIASRIGLSEPSALCRAFRRWTGDSPQRWRAASTAASLNRE